MKIVDNFLDKDTFEELQFSVLSESMRWRYIHQINSLDFSKKGYFVHNIYVKNRPESDMYDWIEENFLSKFPEMISILRCRLVMYMGGEVLEEHATHIDYDFASTGALLYLNTNDGYTLLSDGTKVKSVENRLLVHPSNQPHSSTNCTDTSRRVVLVLNYL